MRKRAITAIILAGVLLLTACASGEVGTGEADEENTVAARSGGRRIGAYRTHGGAAHPFLGSMEQLGMR